MRDRKRGGYFGSVRTDKNIMRETKYQRFGIGKIVRHKRSEERRVGKEC